ncbi:NUB1 protein, partial [Atractosteus spatula]|nr:NUB1 protein [Atractosteus spatula]
MAEELIEIKLKQLLREEKVELWKEPYTSDNNQAAPAVKALAERYASQLHLDFTKTEHMLETIRTEAVKRGLGNNEFRDRGVATLELRVGREKKYLPTRLNITTEELVKIIAGNSDNQQMKLILNGKQLQPGKTLEEQNVKHNSKIMILNVSKEQKQKIFEADEKYRFKNEGLKRTEQAFQILSDRDGSADPRTTPFLEIADQKGNPIQIPHEKRKALILAMGLHEKGRALMKKKNYEPALSHLLQADEEFINCGSQLLNTVDNYAVLQLDIVWCYNGLKCISCLNDAKERLQQAEACFLRCYGEQQERLLEIKGSTGKEQVLFLRLYLLQAYVSFYGGKEHAAVEKLKKVEDLYMQLYVDPTKMTELMMLGYTEQEARLCLRACNGNVNNAANLIMQRREEKEELKRKEREKRRKRLEDIDTLMQLGYPRKVAAEALRNAGGDVDLAFQSLLDTPHLLEPINTNILSSESDPGHQQKIDQLTFLGFDYQAAEAALRHTGGAVDVASQLLARNQGNLPPEIPSPSSPSPPSEEPRTVEEADQMEVDLVNEALEDIPKHEEDYLDLTLDEECEVIALLKQHLSSCPP